jgi:hypothetical protein
MDAASQLIYATAGASFVLYAATLLWRVWRGRAGVSGCVMWSAAFALMIVHVAAAFHFAHHWSHQSAYDETARQTAEAFGVNWGGGVFANYALLIVWAVEVVNWWRGRLSTAAQVFLAFMWFNGAVVFGHGWIRWFGVVVFLFLGATQWITRKRGDRGLRGSGGQLL